MSVKVLHVDRLYRAEQIGPDGWPVTIVAFQQRTPGLHPTEVRVFGQAFLPPVTALRKVRANIVGISASRNCWFLDPEVLPIMDKIRARFGQTRIVTYGSSAGGMAAFNLAGVLGADYAVAYSPLVDISPAYLAEIKDRRYVEDAALARHDGNRIVRGEAQGQRGLVLFDSAFGWDAAHARRLAALTACDLIEVPYGGHPCTRTFDAVYGLKALFLDMIAGDPPVAEIAARVAEGVQQLPEYRAARLESVAAFVAEAKAAPDRCSMLALYNAVILLRDNPKDLPEIALGLLTDLAGALQHPHQLAHDDQVMRSMANRGLAIALRRRGRKDLALAHAQATLNPAIVEEFRAMWA